MGIIPYSYSPVICQLRLKKVKWQRYGGWFPQKPVDIGCTARHFLLRIWLCSLRFKFPQTTTNLPDMGWTLNSISRQFSFVPIQQLLGCRKLSRSYFLDSFWFSEKRRWRTYLPALQVKKSKLRYDSRTICVLAFLGLHNKLQKFLEATSILIFGDTEIKTYSCQICNSILDS